MSRKRRMSGAEAGAAKKRRDGTLKKTTGVMRGERRRGEREREKGRVVKDGAKRG